MQEEKYMGVPGFGLTPRHFHRRNWQLQTLYQAPCGAALGPIKHQTERDATIRAF